MPDPRPEALDSAAPLLLVPHEHRGAVLEEVHARPFRPVATPARVLHFGFVTGAAPGGGRQSFHDFCTDHGVPPPLDAAKHHRATFGGMTVTWEQHGEFATYAWQLADTDGQLFARRAGEHLWLMRGVRPSGRHLISVDLQLMPPESAPDFATFFDPNSLCVMTEAHGLATVATDFKAQPDGFVRIVVIDRGLDPVRAGALVLRLLELETYRLMALLGLPEAQRLMPSVGAIERQLVEVTRQMTRIEGLDENQRLLDELASLAAELEAGAAASAFRFGATRAYQEIVEGRLAALGLVADGEHETIGSFLTRRMGPAMRTCSAVEDRQSVLSSKLARAAQLLRAKVDVGLQRQNSEILGTLSQRTAMQLRLQHTVEGLSIAAVSYYVLGILAHVFAAGPRFGVAVEPDIAVAIATPLVVVAVGWVVLHRLSKHKGQL